MKTYQIEGVEVTVDYLPELSEQELKDYVDYVKYKVNGRLEELSISPGKDPEDVILSWKARCKFERIRRITGYLVGTIDRWNDAKRAEESQRVKHTRWEDNE